MGFAGIVRCQTPLVQALPTAFGLSFCATLQTLHRASFKHDRWNIREDIAVVILGWILLIAGIVTGFGNLTGGGLVHQSGASARLLSAVAVAALGAWLAFG